MLYKRPSWFIAAVAWVICLATLEVNAQADSGADSAASRAYKIGIVDVNEVFNKYQKQIDERAKLVEEKEGQQAKLDLLDEKILAAQNTLKEKGAAMSAEDVASLRESIDADINARTTEYTRAQRDIERKENKISLAILTDIRKAVKEIGSKENYHLVLEVGLAGRTDVLYFSTRLNMTQKVLDYLSSNYKKP